MKGLKKGTVVFERGRPMKIEEAGGEGITTSKQQRRIIQKVADSVKAYRQTASELLDGKYVRLRTWAPAHLVDPGNVLIACCQEGVVVRYERKHDDKRLIGSWISESLLQVAELLSQGVVYCYTNEQYSSLAPTRGIELTLRRQNDTGDVNEPVAAARISFDVPLQRPERLPEVPQKPFCLLSARNSIEIQLLGELLRDEGGTHSIAFRRCWLLTKLCLFE